MADDPPSSSPPEDTEEEEEEDDDDEDAKTSQNDGDSSDERNANGRESVSIAEMEACLETGNAFNRELVARVILDTLRSIPVPDAHHDLSRVLAIISRLGEDSEPSVRAELMEQVPHVAMYCHEEKDEHHWMHLVPSFLLPLVVRYLTDINNQVRKTAQAALLVLLEQQLVAHNDVEEQVCPLLMMLTNPDAHDDFRTEAAALMCRMAPLLGGDLSRRVFLERFAALSGDSLFHVRKICAANFGEFSGVVGQDVTESLLLDKFYALCQDELWGVRKACAEVFAALSRVVSASKRRQEFSTLFVNLLQDESRWVRMAAFQALGPFISTFSRIETDRDDDDAAASSAEHHDYSMANHEALSAAAVDAEIERDFNSFSYWRDPLPELNPAEAVELTTNNSERPRSPPPPSATTATQESVSDSVEKALEDLMARVELGASASTPAAEAVAAAEPVHAFDLRRVACQELLGSPTSAPGGTSSSPAAGAAAAAGTSSEPPSYETISATQESTTLPPPPPPPIGLSFVTPPLSSVVPLPTASNSLFQPGSSSSMLPPAYKSPSPSGGASNELSFTNSFYPYYAARRRSDGANRPYSPHDSSARSSTSSLSSCQSVVPQNLMDYYLQMTDPYYVETVDAEITRHCAYSLPAVVCTLGKEHWPLLRDLYTTLASDMQWKVRRTLAFSIHEIAAILDQELIVRDLLPVFDGFLKDLDEVRIGVLKHLSDFLRVLPDKERRGYLPRLGDFLKLDNEQNWRFRQELALQLQSVVVLYSPAESAQSILPLALTLASDRVAAVRLSTFTLISQIMKRVSECGWASSSSPEGGGRGADLTALLAELTARFCTGNRWMLRQCYVNICNQLVTDEALPLDDFARLLLAPLLALRQDRVPNVRLVLARVINLQLKNHEFFAGSDSPYRELLNETLDHLSADRDRDVSFFATSKRDQTPAYFTSSLAADDESAA